MKLDIQVAGPRASAKGKPKILLLIRSFLPGEKSGGPARTLVNLIDALKDEFSFYLLTRDRDIGDQVPYPDIPKDAWTNAYGANICYISPQNWRASSILALIREIAPDIVYLNSYFEPKTAVFPLLARRFGQFHGVPFVLAPRGALAQSALRLKAAKKKLYMKIAKTIGLYKGLIWQASSEFEASDIKREMSPPQGRVYVAPDLPTGLSASPPAFQPRNLNSPLRICCLARVAPVKNVDFAIGVLKHSKVAVDFSVFGPFEDANYLELCKAQAAQLPASVRVNFKGVIEAVNVPTMLAQHDLMFLPTRGENYGHVIIESLGAGTPVLIADTTPWRNLAAERVGWDLPLSNPQGFAKIIDDLAGLSTVDVLALRARSFAYAKRVTTDGAAVQMNRDLFRYALTFHDTKAV